MSLHNSDSLKKISGIGPKRLSKIVSLLEEKDMTVDHFLAMSPEVIKADFGLPINVARNIASYQSSEEVKPVTEKRSQPQNISTSVEHLLTEKDIITLTLDSPEYPERLKTVLGKQAPSTLYVWGNLDLLNKPAVGFCGSRKATEKGLQVTSDTSKQIAQKDWVVVSGHAKGVDSTAHRVAIENGAGTIIVAPEGILSFRLRRELKKIAKPEQVLIISEFSPKASWNAGYAMKRNRTIIGLSDAMILVEARLEGGTFRAGEQSLELKIPLYVVVYGENSETTEGNRYFLNRNAKPIAKSKQTLLANLTHLIESVEQSRNETSLERHSPQQKQLI